MTVYQRACHEHDRIRKVRDEEYRRHEAEVERLTNVLRDCEQVMKIAEQNGPDVAEAYEIARDVIAVEWRARANSGGGPGLRADRYPPEVSRVFIRAIDDLRLGAPSLCNRYMGIKAYDRWPAQEVDCEYGMAPSHGYVWFRIGLRSPSKVRAEGLTDDQIVACIRWLDAVADHPDEVLPQ